MLVAKCDSELESQLDPGTDIFGDPSSIDPEFLVNQGRLDDTTDLFADVSTTDPVSILNDATLEGTNPLDQWSEPDSSFLLTNNLCGDTSLFNKIRRGDTCRPPAGQIDQPGQSGNEEKSPNSDDGFNFNQFLNYRPKPSFFKVDSDLCPAKFFGSSTTPVCHDIKNVIGTPPGQSKIPMLEYISPRMAYLIGENGTCLFIANSAKWK